ncbi:SGNH/GDSL hydrolase family protein [Spirosoma montaniterrae]|uniref:SGNH/GDSL hydrolase family protein n=1 Tax=Spirosoma montaniterrae TaxID=1178516 RepID=UPI00097D909F|nr:SGNH/GDSL hydrolase family protein [Spirosoma montaniterrae]
MSAPATKTPVWLLKLTALLLPLLLLTGVEGVLRLAGYGYNLDLFITDPQRPDYWVMNPDASRRYFINQANATVGNAEPFLKNKPDNTFRIFVLGESTTVGYPYLHNGSFHRWLQHRLLFTFPARHFEVINVGLTAVNSHTFYGFAKEIVQYKPDAVLIYGGHNEYYGALGVGSTNRMIGSPAVVRWVATLRDLRLVQAVYQFIGWAGSLLHKQQTDLRENLMKRMAADSYVPLDGELYQQGIRQFSENMSLTLALFQEHKVPVYLSTLVSNEKDLPPFVSDTTSASRSADAVFWKATQAYQTGDFVAAKKRFVQAKELDMLRFRAPEAMNAIVRKLATQYTGVRLVDARKVFESHSAHGILGSETLLEHVHPNLLGYALLADAFFNALREDKRIQADWSTAMSFQQSLATMPITAIDSLKGKYEIEILKEGWPFNQPPPANAPSPKTVEEKLAGGLVVRQLSWGAALQNALLHYQKRNNAAGALRVGEALLLEHPYNPDFYVQAGKLAQAARQLEKTRFYWQKAFAMQPSEDLAMRLSVQLLKIDEPETALPYLTYVAARNAAWNDLKDKASQVILYKKAYQADSQSVSRCLSVAEAYLQFANAAAAEKYLSRALALDPTNRQARQLRETARQYAADTLRQAK